MRTNRSILNYSTHLLFAVVTLAVALVSRPLLLRWLGEERLGAFRVTSDYLAMLQLLELGLGGALMAVFARVVNRGSRSEVHTAIVVGVRAYLRVVLFMLAVGVGIVVALPWLVKDLPPQLMGDLRLGTTIGLITLMLVPLFPFRSLAEASQRGYFINILLIVQSLIITALTLLLAWAGWGITGQFIALVVGAVVVSGTLTWDGLRRHDGLWSALIHRPDETEAEPTRRELKRLKRPTLLNKINARISYRLDNIVVNLVLGVQWVVPFFFTQQLIHIAKAQLQAVGGASWASLAQLHLTDQRDLFRRRLIELTKLVAIFSVATLVPVAIYNFAFISMWIGPNQYAGDWVTILAAANAGVVAVHTIWGWVFQGTGLIRQILPMTTVSMVVNAVLSVVCTLLVGLPGPLLGSLAGRLGVNMCWFPLLMRRHYGIRIRHLMLALVGPMALGVPYTAAVLGFARSWPARNLLELAVQLASWALVYLALAWGLLMTRDERRLWLGRVQNVIGAITRRWPSRKRAPIAVPTVPQELKGSQTPS